MVRTLMSGAATGLKRSRMETDLLGEIEVPRSALYGAQTRRAIANFPADGARTIGHYHEMIRALMVIKKAAALANLRAGQLDEHRATAIAFAADSVLRDPIPDAFPVHALHGGGGTSANMNANEVLANLAEEHLGGHRGTYRTIHPNDHVNLNQSTNDVYPTACHMAVVLRWPTLEDELWGLSEALLATAQKFGEVPRIARTCLQDAVATTYRDFFGAYAALIDRCSERVGEAVDRLHEVNLGGTIVGRTQDVNPEYFDFIIEELRRASGDERYRRSGNLFLSAQSPDDLVAVSAALDLLARSLIKIAQDLRLLASGPESGLQEIRLPAVQPGSSIMPGKVNPVIPEFLIQQCFRVAGNHLACEMAVDHGELDLNIWESVLVFNILDSMALLATGVAVFEKRCLEGLEVDRERNVRHAESIIPLLTELMREHKYSRLSDACKRSKGEAAVLRRILKEEGLIP